jgi:Ice-binding-like
VVSLALVSFAWTAPAGAAVTVQLGTAAPFAVLAGTAVTDVPTSAITGNVGLSPAAGSNYAGLTSAEVTGTIYATDATGPGGSTNDPALLTTAKNDLTTAFVSAAGEPTTTTFTTGDNQLGGQTLTGGVYAFGHAATANISAASPLTLNGQGDPNSVFVFQASSDLVTASNSVVQLENGAQACNVFWEVGSSATLNSASTFVGTLMALTSASLKSAATVQGRVLARNGAVTLDNNTITIPSGCATTSTVTSTTPAGTGGAGTTGSHAATTGSTGTLAGSGTRSAGSTGSGTGTSATGLIPVGAPGTGQGGLSSARDTWPLVLGVLAVLASGGAAVMAVRRRHGLPAGVGPNEGE